MDRVNETANCPACNSTRKAIINNILDHTQRHQYGIRCLECGFEMEGDDLDLLIKNWNITFDV